MERVCGIERKIFNEMRLCSICTKDSNSLLVCSLAFLFPHQVVQQSESDSRHIEIMSLRDFDLFCLAEESDLCKPSRKASDKP